MSLDNIDLKWRQRAKLHWYKAGDRNTLFFHQYASKRKENNQISSLKDASGVPQDSPSAIEQIILDHFGSIFTASVISNEDISTALGRVSPRFTSAMTQLLMTPYTEEEIGKALKHMQSLKSPGPDGMSPIFFKKFWHVIKVDVVSYILNFLNNHTVDPNINFTHIVLIPKIKNPDVISQFRPISLCNVIYKLASKVLANRIRTVLPDIISPSQSAFVPGRLITDNVLIAHEIHHHMKTKAASRTGLMSIKLDMSKAFDRIEWSFLKATMNALGFPPSFVDLIMACVSTTSFSFLLNGAEFGKLTPQRGIRQGDPLSPYLFIICSEVFSCLLQDLQRCDKIRGIAVSRSSPSISHLFFADDTLLLGRATTDEARHFRFAINLYERVSGQLVNLDKSGIVFSKDVDHATASSILQILGFKRVDSHGKYLGLPSIIGRNKQEIFGHIKDRIWNSIQGWSRHNFSKAGKEILIKSVLQAIPSYAMSCFKFTESVIMDIQSMISNFWWGSSRQNKKIHWVAWDKLARSKSDGGLGFRSLRALNLALLSKQAWRILTCPSSLLGQIFKAKYFSNCSFMEATLGYRPSWAWRSILDSRRVLKLGCLRRIHSGSNTKIWGENWLPKPPFTPPLPIVTPFSATSTVNTLINTSTAGWNHHLILQHFPLHIANLIFSIPLSLSNRPDSWYWSLNKNKKFSVKSSYYTILSSPSTFPEFHPLSSSSAGPSPIWKRLWRLKIPGRTLHFSWRLLTNSLPDPFNLSRRHIDSTPNCPMCDHSELSSTHLFFTCPFASLVWYASGLKEIVSAFQQPIVDLWSRDVILGSPDHISEFFLLICNNIWEARNRKIFENQAPHAQSLVISASQSLSMFRQANQIPERVALEEHCRLFKPPPTGIHIFFDGAISTSRACAGIGIFIQNADGSFMHGMAKKIQGIVDPLQAELLALREAISIASTLQLANVSFLGDSATIVEAVRENVHPSPDCDPVLLDILSHFHPTISNSLFWIPRTDNLVAHEFAQYAKSELGSLQSWAQPPTFLSQSVLDLFQ